ncbi:hypothetical protein HK11_11135 [Acetobacter sp. DmW_043]|nr:hypothetical protein HK11_11135 [Acetobacter sp. DmW_043]
MFVIFNPCDDFFYLINCFSMVNSSLFMNLKYFVTISEVCQLFKNNKLLPSEICAILPQRRL